MGQVLIGPKRMNLNRRRFFSRVVLTLCLAGCGSAVWAQSFSEGFEDIHDANGDSSLSKLLGRGWSVVNSSNPLGTVSWFFGNGSTFQAHTGSGFIACNYLAAAAAGTISAWLCARPVHFHNGDTISFYTRSNGKYPDRLELRLSTGGTNVSVGSNETSVGLFTNLLLSVNPKLVTGGYPVAWTRETVKLSGLPAAGATGRFAFRVFETSAGFGAVNGDYVGIDDVVYTAVAG